MLSGKVAVKNRNALVRKFETDPNCKIFLSSEAGGAGLNLQIADTVINFEMPWNPAKKNQRLGRIDRLGQRSKHLNVINFITRDSFELKIASGLNLKQNLFDSVLNSANGIDIVDFSAEGKAQFLQQIEETVSTLLSVDEISSTEAILTYEENYTEEEDFLLEQSNHDEIIPSEDGEASIMIKPDQEPAHQTSSSSAQKIQEMEQVMNHGLDFISGLFKMANGNQTALEGRKMEFDKETGEVVLRFKMP